MPIMKGLEWNFDTVADKYEKLRTGYPDELHKIIEIKKLDYDLMKGQCYHAEIYSDKYLSIEPQGDGFQMEWRQSETDLNMAIDDTMLSDWLENPVAYGAYEDNEFIGFIEGFLEKWNNRFRITNICVLNSDKRNSGIGQKLMEKITIDAVNSGARMIVLETQSFNSKAISFYKKNGFEIIGFDRYAYSNNGPEEHNMRIEMGKKIIAKNVEKDIR